MKKLVQIGVSLIMLLAMLAAGANSAFAAITAYDPIKPDMNSELNWDSGTWNDQGKHGVIVENEHGNFGYIVEGNWAKFSDVDFGHGPSKVKAEAAYDEGSLTLSIDKPDGPVIAVVEFSPSGGLHDYEWFEADVESVRGVHDLYVTFNTGRVNVRNIQFMDEAEPPSRVTLVEDDFENDEIGTTPSGYVHSTSAEGVDSSTSSVTVTNVPDESTGNPSDKALRVHDSNGAEEQRSRTIVTKSFEPQNGSVVVEFDLMEPRAVGNSYPMRLEDKQNGKSGFIIEVSSGHLGYRGSDNSWHPFLLQGEQVPLESNTWYNIKLLADIANGFVDVYINGSYVDHYPFYESVDTLNATESQTAGSSEGDLYWDHVRVYVEATDSPKGLHAAFGDQQVQLYWEPANGAESYNVKRSTSDGGPYTLIATGVKSPSYLDGGLTNHTTYYYIVTAVNSAGESQPSNQVSVTPTEIPNPPGTPSGLEVKSRNSQADLSWNGPAFGNGKEILFVGAGNEADDRTIAHFESLGFTVDFIQDKQVAATDSEGYDLIFIGESVNSGNIGKKFKHTTVPVIYAEPFVLDDVKLSSSEDGDFGSLEGQIALTIHNNSHPLAAGLDGDVIVYSQAGNLNYASPGENAIVIAGAASDPGKAVIFGYEQGSERLNGETIPARRVSTFLFAGQEQYLTEDGWNLIEASLQWALGMESEDAAAPVDYYKVKRSTSPEGPFTTAAEVEGTKYRDAGLQNGTVYYYVITANNIGGESDPSETASTIPAAPLDAPAGLKAEAAGNNAVTISWNEIAGADSYAIKRSTEKGIGYEVIAEGITEAQYTDHNAANGTRYYYVVSAVNEIAASANSMPVTAVPSSDDKPAVPADLAATAGDTQVWLTWSAVSGAETYTVKRALFGSTTYEVIASGIRDTSYQDTGLTNGVTYDYVISAAAGSTESYASEPIAVTPAAVVIVAANGSGHYTTVQDAIDAAPDNSDKRHVIFIKNGEYREKLVIPASKQKLSLVGESKEDTVLIYNDSAKTLDENGNEIGTFNSSSTFVYGEDFIAKNLTFQNDAGMNAGQAVAIMVRADRAYFENVRFLGFQDTLLTLEGREYYKDCYIEGSVDYIFGDAQAVFDNCQIHTNRDGGMLTAASTPQHQPFGYVFLHSEITSGSEIDGVRLGRPWRPYSAVAFINTVMDASIAADGWDNWGNSENEKTARYAEFNSKGPGANPQARDGWTIQLTPKEANLYTVQNLLKGTDGWNPERIGIIPTTAVSAPILTVNQSDVTVNEADFMISGKVDKEAVVTVNDVEVPLQSNLSFETTVALEPGENTITIEALDEEGNWAMPIVLQVVYDNTAPSITLMPEGKKNGNHYNTIYNPYPVFGRLSEQGTVKINGMEAEVLEDLTFHLEVELKPGMNRLTVTASDMAGNVSDPVQLQVVPAGNAVPYGPVKIIKSEVVDAHTIEVVFNSKLQKFEESDFQMLAATNPWHKLNPALHEELTVTKVQTKVNKDGQTAAYFTVEETLNEDGILTRDFDENPFDIPYLRADYYSGNESEDIAQADYLISWQMDHGGWFKNMQDDQYTRMWDGQENKSDWVNNGQQLGTIDNNATTDEILFLAVMYKQTGEERFKAAVLKGLDYLFEAQYDSGGWPQSYPARGGYSDYVTFNDNAMTRVMNVLRMVSEKKYPFNSELVGEDLIERAEEALARGLDFILKSQIVVNGKLTAWCAQHDPVTYEPREARSYEHPSISGSESTGVLAYLMSIENPSAEVQAAIDGALSWFEASKVEGMRYESGNFYEDENSTTWYRFYEIGTNLPIFSSRDGIIKHDITEISDERRYGYAWAGNWPQKLLNIANTTGYYEERVYVKVVNQATQNAAGETLEIGTLSRIE